MTETQGATEATGTVQGAVAGGEEKAARGWPVLVLIIAAVFIYALSAAISGVIVGAGLTVLQLVGLVPADLSLTELLTAPDLAEGPIAPYQFAVVGAAFLFNAVAMAALVLLIARRSVAGGRAAAVPMRPVAPSAIIGGIIVVPFVTLTAIIVAYRLARIPIPVEAGFDPADWRMWVYPISLIVAVPIAEEITFRGWLFSGVLRRTGSAKWAVWITAILWALLHVSQGGVKVAALLPTGLLLGVMRLKTGSLRPTIAGHMAMNAAGLVYMIWLASG
jgi:membrane protease YdiL (CAAX protease family)